MPRWKRDKRGKADLVGSLRAAGISRRKIAEQTGISMSHIDRLIRAFGLKKWASLNSELDQSSEKA